MTSRSGIGVELVEAGARSRSHRHRHGPIDVDHQRRRALPQHVAQLQDA
jgi:hypothetical protein